MTLIQKRHRKMTRNIKILVIWMLLCVGVGLVLRGRVTVEPAPIPKGACVCNPHERGEGKVVGPDCTFSVVVEENSGSTILVDTVVECK
jgi:hypothetical protein